MQRVRRLSQYAAVLAIVGLAAGCASSRSSASGANTLEGGVKIPSSTPASTVHVTLSDTQGLGGPMTLDGVAGDGACG